MQKATHFPHIRNISVSGRLASGQTTLAKSLSEALGWKMWECGALTEKYYIETLKNVQRFRARAITFWKVLFAAIDPYRAARALNS